MELFHLGDEPDIRATIIEDDEALDISQATNLKFYFQTPRNEIITKTALLLTTGTDGKLHYQTDATFFPISRRKELVGQWSCQASCVIGSHPFTSNVGYFEVDDVLRRT